MGFGTPPDVRVNDLPPEKKCMPLEKVVTSHVAGGMGLYQLFSIVCFLFIYFCASSFYIFIFCLDAAYRLRKEL